MDQLMCAGWRLAAQGVEEEDAFGGFALPGAKELASFASLIGEEEPRPVVAGEEERTDGVAFTLPGYLPEEATGEAELYRLIRFARFEGEKARLTFPMLCGRGEIRLGGQVLSSFCNEAVTLDLTPALRLGKPQTLSLHFDAARPAGVFGMPTLHVIGLAEMREIVLLPDADRRTVGVSAQISAEAAGEYALRVGVTGSGQEAAERAFRETTLTLEAGRSGRISMSVDMPGERFVPGRAHTCGAVRLELLRKDGEHLSRPGTLCDHAVLLCGYAGREPLCWVPLTREDCAMPPDALCEALTRCHIHAVSMPEPPAEATLLALCRAGVGVVLPRLSDKGKEARLARFPCVSFRSFMETRAATDAQSAWLLCGMTGAQRRLDPFASDEEMLREAAGRKLDPAAPGIPEILEWLRAVRVRFAAEAAAQGMLTGEICAPGEWRKEDVAQALAQSLAPEHLSALPLCGAWWTDTRFSAALRYVSPKEEGLSAYAALEDEEGHVLHSVTEAIQRGSAGVFSADLPSVPCVLTLSVRLLRGETVVEEYTLPVYVGLRGPLEAAF